jgi:RNA polymerase sigma-70 factor, ECF subfamily
LKNHLAIQRVVSEFHQPVYRFALAVTGSESEAADLTQQAFSILYEQPEKMAEPDKIKSRLFAALRGRLVKTVGARPARSEMCFAPKEAGHLSAAPGTVIADEFWAALSQLEEDCQTVLELFYLGDLSYKEIADTLEIPVGMVMSRLSRGKERLRRAMTKASADARAFGLPGRCIKFNA